MADDPTIGKLIIQMLLDDESYGEGLDDVKKKTKALGIDLSGLADMLNDLVVGAFKAATVATAGLAAASAYVGATFEQKMTTVATIAGATGAELESLTDKARELGATTNFSASEAADAMALLAGAGMDTNEVLTATSDALVLAGAGGTKLDTAAAALTSTLSQFSMQASESGRVADVFAASTAKSQFTVDDLAEAMKYGGTVGAGFKWSLEQTVAALAQFRDMGLSGAGAGTALRSAMVGATTDTKKNRDALEKYGLTMKDINPELHSFEEILTNVGLAGVSTTDAMVVFGSEAGAVVKSLADKFAAGESNYQEMLTTLETSSGVATTMFGQMTDTVMGRFQNLQSAVEEFLLTMYDQYSAPIRGLLEAIANVVNQVSVQIQGRSAEIQGSLADSIGWITDFLNANAAYIANTFADFIQYVADLTTEIRHVVAVLDDMLPILDDLILTMGLLWVTTKVAAFAAVIGDVVSAFAAAGWSVKGFMVILTEATGGIYALVAGIGTLLAGLVYLANRYLEAASAAGKLKAAQDALTAKTAAADDARVAVLEKILSTQQEAAQHELDTSDKLSAARKTELQTIIGLSAATAAQAEAEGKLVVVRGQLRSVGSIVDELDPETMNEFDKGVQSLKTSAGAAAVKATELKEAIAKANEAIANGGVDGSKTVQVLLHGADSAVDSVVAAQVQLAELQSQSAEYTARAKALEQERTKAVTGMREDELRNIQSTEKGKLSAAESALGASGKKEKEYVDKVAELHQRLNDKLNDVGTDKADSMKLEMERELRDTTAAYAEQIKAAGNNAEEVKRLEKQLVIDKLIIRTTYQRKQETEDQKAREATAEKEAAEAKRVAGIVAGIEQQSMTASQKLAIEKAEVLAGIDDKYGAEKLRIAAGYDKAITEAQAEETAEQARLAEQATGRWIDGFVRVGRAVSSAMSAVSSAMKGAVQVARDFVSFLADGLEQLTGFAFSLRDAVESVVDAMSTARKNAQQMALPGGGTASITGPMADVGVASGVVVNAAVDAAITFVETAVAAIPLLITALVDALPQLIDALVSAIPDVITALIDALPSIIQMLIAQVPRVMTALAENLPALIQAVVSEIPKVIDAILPQLGPLLDALVQIADTVILGVIASAPDLVIGIIDMIPQLVAGIMAKLPEIITGLVEGVSDIVTELIDQLPNIIGAILEQLPNIVIALVTSLVESIPGIVLAFVEAVPKIIAALINARTKIIGALISTLPKLITALIALIPDLIVAVVDALPILLPAIVSMIPDIITEVIKALPAIVSALFTAFFVELPQRLPEMAVEIGKALLMAIVNSFESLVASISALFKAAWDALVKIFGKDKDSGSAYAGIDYVPATMRLTVHPGEAVVPASRNASGRGNRSDPAMAGGSGGSGNGGGGGGPQELAVLINGRVIERAIFDTMAQGGGNKLTRFTRAASGVRAGLDRGRFNHWK